MVKCPFCGFDNEDGELFCEQCKSDLSSAPTPAPVEPVPVAAVLDDPSPSVPSYAANEAIAARAETLPFLDLDNPPVPIALAETLPVMEALPMAEALPVAEAVSVEETPAAEKLPVAEAMPAAELKHVADAEPPSAVAEVVAIPEPPPTVPMPAPAAPAAAEAPPALPAGAQPRLKVMRGVKVGVEFPIYPDYNYIGRADEKPVDIDLEDQEPPDRVWCSRQHAVIHFDEASGALILEDLNSSNGTFVNRTRVYPGEKRSLKANDVVQIGTVHLKLLV